MSEQSTAAAAAAAVAAADAHAFLWEPIPRNMPAQSLREKLLHLRAKSRATLAAGRRGSTPRQEAALAAKQAAAAAAKEAAALDAQKPPPVTPQAREAPVVAEQSRLEVQQLRLPEEPALAYRSVQPSPHTPTYPSKLGLHSENSDAQPTIPLNPVHLGDMEFIIPLSMNTRVKDQYISTIHTYQHVVRDFLQEEVRNDKNVEEIRRMLERVNQVTTHIDLDSEGSLTQEQHIAEEEALWAENCSAKFKFLRHLFEAIYQLNVHIGIVARSGRLLDILETFLRGRHVRYNRPDTVSRSDKAVAKGRLSVTLLASGQDGASYLPRPATLVIAFDGTFNAQDPQVKLLRNHLVNVDQLHPVIHLLVYGSAEHIDRCIPQSMESVERLRKVVRCMTETRYKVGQLLPDELGASIAAEEVAVFLEAGAMEKDWTFPAIRPIDGLETSDLPHEPTNESENNSLPTTTPMARQSSNPKRVLDGDVDTLTQNKRQKMTPSGEGSNANDSVTDPLQTDLHEELKQAREKLVEAETLHSSLQAGMKNSQQKLETELAIHQETKRMLREYTESLEDLQTRFEDKMKKYRTLNAAKEVVDNALATAINRAIFQSEELVKVKKTIAGLETELKESRAALLDSPELSIAEREGFNAEIRTLKESTTTLEKRVANLNNDLEYCRKQYQIASNAAAEGTNRISELESELSIALRRASGEGVKLATLNRSNDNNQLRHEVQILQREVKSREDLLRRKEEELRDLKRGRAGAVTRGNSVGGKSSRGASPGTGAGGHTGGKVGGSALRFG